ncbi:uncharacterized protein LOC142223992 [Haematobia irritans]
MAAISIDPLKFKASLTQNDLVKNYDETMEKMDPDSEDYDELWENFSQVVVDCISKILFETKTLNKADTEKASCLLKKYREDACFINPTFFNQWIYKFRDELLKKTELLDFWKNEMVAKELGPLWARDCDFYDEMDDPKPVEFYKQLGCEAPWLKEKDTTEKTEAQHPLNLMSNTAAGGAGISNVSGAKKSLKKITKENALEDYKNNMLAQQDINSDDEEAYKKIFGEVRDILWQLLFDEPSLTEERSKMAAGLLQEYKTDACFFAPYDYNTWIEKVRDELFKRKYFDFWKIIVKEQLGLCWAKDSDFFDDMDDPKPMAFYKSGDELMKHKK